MFILGIPYSNPKIPCSNTESHIEIRNSVFKHGIVQIENRKFLIQTKKPLLKTRNPYSKTVFIMKHEISYSNTEYRI